MTAEFDQRYAAEQIRRRESWLRRLVKAHYLDNLSRRLDGPTIDLGCGAGQLLERLPLGSIGLELNSTLVTYLHSLKLEAMQYDALADDFALSPLVQAGRGRYRHLVCAHVVEHFTESAHAMGRLLDSGRRLDLESMIFVVPGRKGFTTDPTHRCFVTADLVRAHGLDHRPPFRLATVEYFPGNWRRLGNWFAYHECILTWSR